MYLSLVDLLRQSSSGKCSKLDRDCQLQQNRLLKCLRCGHTWASKQEHPRQCLDQEIEPAHAIEPDG